MKYFKPKSMERYILRTPGAFIKILKYQIFTVILNVKNELQNVYNNTVVPRVSIITHQTISHLKKYHDPSLSWKMMLYYSQLFVNGQWSKVLIYKCDNNEKN